MLDLPTRDRFAPLLNSQFQLEHSNGSIDIELIEVSELRVSRSNESFSLVFRGPGNILIPQAMYRFNHAALGVVDLFIVPIGRDEHGLYYEALFNQLRDQKEV